jgi:hypothetical protein
MKVLNYKVACKSCLQTDGMNHLLMITGSNSDLIENRLLKSAYSLERYVKDQLRESNQPCQFCGSNNLAISDIEFDGKKAMVDSNVDQFQLVLSKIANGQIEIKTGGSQYLPFEFLPEAIKVIEDAIQGTALDEFEEKQVGTVRFVVSTGFIGNDEFRTNRLEQFSYVGFSKQSLLNMVRQIKTQILQN